MKMKFLITLLAALLVVTQAQASDFPGINKLMKQLSIDLQIAQKALLTEDHETLAKAAKAIADHPMISFNERMKVMAKLNTDMPKFKAWDGKTHDAGVALAEAALKQDRDGETKAFTELVQG